MEKQLQYHINDAINQTITTRLQNLHTASIGNIASYNSSTGLADISLIYYQRTTDADGLPQRAAPIVIPNVPILQLYGGSGQLTMPVNVGDSCLIIFCERPIAQWKYSGSLVDPQGNNNSGLVTHNINDAIAIVGVRPAGISSTAVPLSLSLAGNGLGVGTTTTELVGTQIAIGNGAIELLSQLASALGTIASAFAGSLNPTLVAAAPAIQLIATTITALSGSIAPLP